MHCSGVCADRTRTMRAMADGAIARAATRSGGAGLGRGLNSSAGMTNEFYQGWAPGMTPGRIAVGRFPSATGGPTGTSMHPGSSDQGDGNWWYVRYDTDVGVAIGCGNVWIRRSRSAAAPQPVVACRGRRTARGKFSVGQRGGAGEQCPLIPSVFRVVVAIPSGANGTAGRNVGHRRAAGTVPDRTHCHPDRGGVEQRTLRG